MTNKTKTPARSNVTVSIDKDQLDYVRKLTYSMSASESRRVSFSELVRVALTQRFPVPKDQLEFDLKQN